MGRPADGLALAKTAETNTASAPQRRARTTAVSEWAAAVTIQVGRDRLMARASAARRSGRCTPSAPICAARPASAPASTSRPRRRAALTKLRPFATASGVTEGAVDDAGAARQAGDDRLGIGRPGRIGEEEQPRQGLPSHPRRP